MARAAPDGGHVVWHRSRHDGLGMHVTSVRDAGIGEIRSNRARTGHATVQYNAVQVVGTGGTDGWMVVGQQAAKQRRPAATGMCSERSQRSRPGMQVACM